MSWRTFGLMLLGFMALLASVLLSGCATLDAVGDAIPVRTPNDLHRQRLVDGGCYTTDGVPVVSADEVEAYACMLRADDYRAVWSDQ